MVKRVAFAIVIFLAGWLASSAIMIGDTDPVPRTEGTDDIFFVFDTEPVDRISPHDWVNESQIHVSNAGVIIDIEDAEWAKFTDTNSMDPIIDQGANAIQIVPSSPEMIHVGDIISYVTELREGVIIHRVIEIGEDDEGWFAITKGDNLRQQDPLKVRFDQIRRILIAIIY